MSFTAPFGSEATKSLGACGAMDDGEPILAALFRGFDGELLPLGDLGVGLFLIDLRDAVIGLCSGASSVTPSSVAFSMIMSIDLALVSAWASQTGCTGRGDAALASTVNLPPRPSRAR